MQNEVKEWNARIFGSFTFRNGVSDEAKEKLIMKLRSIGDIDFLWWEEACKQYQFHSRIPQFIDNLKEIKKFVEENSHLLEKFDYNIEDEWGVPDPWEKH